MTEVSCNVALSKEKRGEKPMDARRNILIAVDDSEATKRAITYVATMLGGEKDFHIHLMHRLPSYPPELLEFGGTENPELEKEKEAEIRNLQAKWLKEAEKAAKIVFDSAKGVLRQAGVPMRMVNTHCCSAAPGENLVTDILEDATTHACSTIVIGRESFSGLKRLYKHHVADELVRRGQGLTIWVVE